MPLPHDDHGAAEAVEDDLPHGMTSADSTPERKGSTVDEDYLAARCAHYHGDGSPMPDDERRALDEKQRLADRTWRKGRELNRDGRKLLARLERFDRARKARNREHFRRCPTCSGNT